MRHAVEQFASDDLSDFALSEAPLDRLADPAELALIRELASWPRVVESAAEAREPHRIAFYLQDVAAMFHTLWNKGKDETALRFILTADPLLTRARLALVRGVAIVVAWVWRSSVSSRWRRVSHDLSSRIDRSDRRAELLRTPEMASLSPALAVCWQPHWLWSSWYCSAVDFGSPMSRALNTPAGMPPAAPCR